MPAPDAGIIPARAGFTRRPRPPHGPGSDHPRSRGVYSTGPSRTRGRTGSSPLARGLRSGRLPSSGASRIIPARAGFTSKCGAPAPQSADHPRSRGVYGGDRGANFAAFGSSPLARGLPQFLRDGVRRLRIIPARAGFTLTCSPRRINSPDHPRSRGVYFHSVSAPDLIAGSSPLARGLR